MSRGHRDRRTRSLQLGELRLPAMITAEFPDQFVAAQRLALEQFEHEVLSCEQEARLPSAEFWGMVHSIKGESGVFGLDDLQDVCHSLEELREPKDLSPQQVADRLLAAKDWIAAALDAYAEHRLPAEAATAFIEQLTGPVEKPALRNARPTDELADLGPAIARDEVRSLKRELVKVDLGRIDALAELVGELVVAETMLRDDAERAEALPATLRSRVASLSRITHELQEIAMQLRMVPLHGVFQRLRRYARDTAHQLGKAVKVKTSGESTELDRRLVEHLADPLLHLLRNAIDHGIESQETRVCAGKPAEGLISLSARQAGGAIVVEVSDDGRGLHPDAIVAKARERGLLHPDQSPPTSEDLLALIFEPGLSTADTVTDLSGRGIGMDVVRAQIEAIQGRVRVSSVVDEGTTFHITLPLTLAIIEGMVVRSGAERYIVPTLSVIESLRPEPTMIRTLSDQKRLIDVRGEVMPLVRLDQLLRVDGSAQSGDDKLVVLLETRSHKLGLVVDDVEVQRRVVIKSLDSNCCADPLFSGAAILSDGTVGLILNPEQIETMIRNDDDAGHASSNDIGA
jgi:two-component system chemotaxis sensor kinase CheA